MKIPFDDSVYARTFIDFWKFRPQKFIAKVEQDPSSYAKPFSFIKQSITLIIVVFLLIFFAVESVGKVEQLVVPLQSLGGQKTEVASSSKEANIVSATEKEIASSTEIAYKYTAALILSLFLSALTYTIISKVWPVRGKASFLCILKFECYTLSITIPYLIISFIVLSALIISPADMEKHAFEWQIYDGVIYLIYALIASAIWEIPGIATINNVSLKRMWGGILLWYSVIILVSVIVFTALVLL